VGQELIRTQRFKTIVAKSGTRTFIALPFNPNEVRGVKRRHHITGTVNGYDVRGSPGSAERQYFLPLGAAWRRGCEIETGAKVEVVPSPEGPQSESLSPEIAAALDTEPQAKVFFESLATFHRNTYIKWIESAKRPETRRARINEMNELLRAGKKQK
jgi:bacteriocin resistance YdeI/OmpD-like protein/uncharacterized protein DUF1905